MNALRPARGFTLLELLIVLIIAAGVSALAWPRLGTAIDRIRFDGTTRELVSALRYARSVSVTTQRETAVLLDLERGTYAVPGHHRSGTLASGIDAVLVAAHTERQGEYSGAIRFFPDGSSTGGRLTLRAPGASRVLDVNWLTGAVVVLAPRS